VVILLHYKHYYRLVGAAASVIHQVVWRSRTLVLVVMVVNFLVEAVVEYVVVAAAAMVMTEGEVIVTETY
jgi:hypothetical protein